MRSNVQSPVTSAVRMAWPDATPRLSPVTAPATWAVAVGADEPVRPAPPAQTRTAPVSGAETLASTVLLPTITSRIPSPLRSDRRMPCPDTFVRYSFPLADPSLRLARGLGLPLSPLPPAHTKAPPVSGRTP